MRKTYIPPALIVTLALAGCAAGPGTGTTSASEQRSEVEIINGESYTATWQDGGPSTIRLTYDSGIALSDARVVEIAELITGCDGTNTQTDPTLIGGLTSVRVGADCTARTET
jgi:hypothetical protein